MPAIISDVLKDSIADELGFEGGDIIKSINGEVLNDLIDYKFAICSEYIEIQIQKTNMGLEEFEIEKDFDEDLGIVFESAVFDRIKPCTNRCIFCFVDQQPEGLRKSLYIKDDDYRLSYLQGTYITMTNFTQKDRERIEKLRLGPLYVSVHTTNPELRAQMLNNPKAKNIMEDLAWLKKADIPVHLQIVMCPELNDGEELKRTLTDLKKFKSIIQSIAIVPVGITKFHKNNLSLLTKENAVKTIEIIDDFNTQIKKHLAQASDEIFLKAQINIPQKKYYGNFSQLEDGVGALRLLLDDFEKRKKKLPKKLKTTKNIIFASSNSAALVLNVIIKELNKIENLNCSFIEVKNQFFGDNVTVAGLITGKDLLAQLKSHKNIENLVIPSIMIRDFSGDFLDGVTIEEAQEALDCKITVIEDIYSSRELFELF